MVEIHHYTFVQSHKMYNTKREPYCKVQTLSDYVCQSRFILGKACTILVSDVGNRGGCTHVGAKGIWEISVSAFRFCFQPQTALKSNKVLKKEVYLMS